jgi:hypothetical protein
MSDGDPQNALPPQARRRALPIVLVTIASLLAFLAIFALWANRQLLNTDNWTNASSEMLESKAVRTQLSAFVVDQLYNETDVTARIQQALPPRAQPLAGPAAGGLRDLAERSAQVALERPRVQQAWEEANRRAHQRLLQVLDGGGSAVSTGGGEVTIDLTQVTGQTANRLGVGERVAGKLPESAQITVLESDQLSAVQGALKAMRNLPIVLVALVLALFALAVWRAKGWRREAVRACGFALLVAGAAALLVKSIAGGIVVDSLAGTAAVKPAVEDVWAVATELLVDAAVAAVLYGIVVILAAWLAGPSPWAVGLRSALAPYLREPAYAYGALAVFVVIVALWGPTPATRQLVPGLVLIAMLVLGLEALRRQTAREHPHIDREAAATIRRETASRMAAGSRRVFSGAGGSRDASVAEATAPSAREAGDPRMDQLERLAGLHAEGVLNDEEFRRAKASIVGAPT